MREPANLEGSEIVARLRARWGTSIDAIDAVTFLPVGNDSGAWAYRVQTGGGPLFLKIRAGPADPASLAIPRFLADRGIEQVVAPIPTVDGGLCDPGDPFTFILLPFVEGANGGVAGLDPAIQTDLGAVLRRIHDTAPDPPLVAAMRREAFDVGAAAGARRIAELVDAHGLDDPHQRGAAAFWRSRREEIARIVARAEVLGARARARARPHVICHADIHVWNVLVHPDGGYTIVDWDEALLAPRERDLMFVESGVGGLDNDAAAFFAGYGEIRVDPVVMAFYRYEWVVEEIADFARRVFEPETFGEDTRADALASLEEIFAPGQVVEAAYRADHDVDDRTG